MRGVGSAALRCWRLRCWRLRWLLAGVVVVPHGDAAAHQVVCCHALQILERLELLIQLGRCLFGIRGRWRERLHGLQALLFQQLAHPTLLALSHLGRMRLTVIVITVVVAGYFQAIQDIVLQTPQILLLFFALDRTLRLRAVRPHADALALRHSARRRWASRHTMTSATRRAWRAFMSASRYA